MRCVRACLLCTNLMQRAPLSLLIQSPKKSHIWFCAYKVVDERACTYVMFIFVHNTYYLSFSFSRFL